MQKYNESEDKVLRDLFKDFEPDKGSDEIKQRTMDRILQDWSEHPVTISPLINKYNRLWIGLGILAMIAFAYLFDTFSAERFNQLLNSIFSFESYKALKMSLLPTLELLNKIPLIIVLLVVGMSALIGLDRLLNRLANI